ncbi:MAG: hypothetical protein UY06_C0017G0020 [Candidatus Amesbacteria bacterium GW2011_GWA2_47_70]|nr:MAG: hypothetical protein UY06_C0017G0020 [Candidatus Amesbacteria bacterium GW2011_GWA2_47_70]
MTPMASAVPTMRSIMGLVNCMRSIYYFIPRFGNSTIVHIVPPKRWNGVWYHCPMAGREMPLVTGEYYHVFNRGVARLPTFITKQDYQQAMLGLNYYHFIKPPIKLSRFKRLNAQSKAEFLAKLSGSGDKLVDIISFVFMPNHFHLLLRQVTDGGVAKYMSLFTNSYTRYFNTRLHRPGPVFQGVFKAVNIDNNAQLLHLSRYIHLNPYVSGIVSKVSLLTYPWSSMSYYLNGTDGLVDFSLVLSQFKEVTGYRNFVLNHADYSGQPEILDKPKSPCSPSYF